MQFRHWVFLGAVSLLFAPWARGELQNVVVNGAYSMPNEERMAEAAFLPGLEDDGQPPAVRLVVQELEGHPDFYRSAAVCVEHVAVPPIPQVERYSSMARVFLSFYLGVPEWEGRDAGRIDLLVSVNSHNAFISTDGYRAFQCELSEPGWHARLVDMSPWAGEEISLEFRAGWIEGESKETIVALPRVVACHGPYYAGIGGISGGRGPHDMPGAMGGISGERMERAVEKGEAVALVRLDCIEPSVVHVSSAGKGYDAALPKGLYWLPLVLDREEPDIRLETLSGLAERGPMDIVPSFVQGDEQRLEQLAAK